MKIKIAFLFFALTSLVWSQETALTSKEIIDFKAIVAKENTQIKNIKTNFVQYKHLDFLTNDIQSSGQMIFKAPTYLEWEYTEPFKYSVTFKNNKVIINDQGSVSNIDVGSSTVFEKINKMIVGSVSGDMFDDNEFDISYFKNNEGYLVKLLTITDMKKYIKEVNLFFPFKNVSVSQVKLIESSNDYTLIKFINKEINAQLD